LNLGKADLHVHTDIGDGMMSIEELLTHAEHRTDLDCIAVTDHDELRSSHRARDIAVQRNSRVQVIPGMEVTTREGHLLALFLESPVPSLRSLPETVEAIHKAGGMSVVPHPMSWLTHSVGQSALDRLAATGLPPHGLEVANPTYAGQVTERRVQERNRVQYRWAETGGSDAHFLRFVGMAYTLFPGRTSEELRRSLETASSQGWLVAPVRPSEVGTRDLIRQQFRALVVQPFRLLRRFGPLPKPYPPQL
jgi:predicted metal-dependent phosphoesterase TrpH